jgi:hypothetical protein
VEGEGDGYIVKGEEEEGATSFTGVAASVSATVGPASAERASSDVVISAAEDGSSMEEEGVENDSSSDVALPTLPLPGMSGADGMMKGSALTSSEEEEEASSREARADAGEAEAKGVDAVSKSSISNTAARDMLATDTAPWAAFDAVGVGAACCCCCCC